MFRDGEFTLLQPEDEAIFAYRRDTQREHLLVVCNFTDKDLDYQVPEDFEGSRLLISNYPQEGPGLRRYEAAMLYYYDTDERK